MPPVSECTGTPLSTRAITISTIKCACVRVCEELEEEKERSKQKRNLTIKYGSKKFMCVVKTSAKTPQPPTPAEMEWSSANKMTRKNETYNHVI